MAEGSGRHRRPGVPGLVGLIGAVLAAGALLAVPSPRSAAPAPVTSTGPALTSVWPKASIGSQSAILADGTAFTPMLYLDRDTAVGTANTRDGNYVRVLIRTPTATREIQRAKADEYPQFTGFTTEGDALVWAESLSPGKDPLQTRIWRGNWKTAAKPVLLTADTGEAIFFQSQYDLTVRAGVVRWVAVEYTKFAITQVRSVPLSGGKVSVDRVRGAYALTAWPYLVSVSTGQASPVSLFNLETRKLTNVPTNPTEVAMCSPSWCRLVVLAGNGGGAARLDLARPDGSERRRIAGSESTAVVTDVALLDRFEPLATVGAEGTATSNGTLSLFDLTTGRTVVVANSVGIIRGGNGLLWWSTGDAEALTWHALDLRTL